MPMCHYIKDKINSLLLQFSKYKIVLRNGLVENYWRIKSLFKVSLVDSECEY
jgi:hypothetical protein